MISCNPKCIKLKISDQMEDYIISFKGIVSGLMIRLDLIQFYVCLDPHHNQAPCNTLYNHQMWLGYGLAFQQDSLTCSSWTKISKISPMEIEISGKDDNFEFYSAGTVVKLLYFFRVDWQAWKNAGFWIRFNIEMFWKRMSGPLVHNRKHKGEATIFRLLL